MNSTDLVTDLADGKLQLALRRTVSKYGFYAKVLGQMHFTASDDKVATMGVTVRDEKLLLLFNPEFVLDISLRQTVGVLLHECNHVVLGHLTQSKAEMPNDMARTWAQELCANEPIEEALPGNPITLDLFPDFPALESTKQRYDRLMSMASKNQLPGSVIDEHQCWPATTGEQQESGSADGTVTGNGSGTDEIEAVIDDALEQAVAASKQDDVPVTIRKALRDRGIGSRGASSRVGKGAAEVPWQFVLQRYLRRLDKRRRTWKRPNRRWAGQPGWVARPGRIRVMTVIDTSGSISDGMLQDIASELAAMADWKCDLTIVECDCVVHRVYDYEKDAGISPRHGRGGTDLRPALAAELIAERGPQLICYFTDGFGPAGSVAPPVELLWCLVPGGRRPAKWGEVIRM